MEGAWHWFYVKTTSVSNRTSPKVVHYPLASTMEDIRPSTRVTPEVDAARKACDASFATSFCYSRGHDLGEEIVASKFWPLGRKNRPKMKLEKMKLLVFGTKEGVLCPRFGLKRAEDETDSEFVSYVENEAIEILGNILEKEYLAHWAIGGNMPHLNWVFEEMDVKYTDHKVPPNVLKSIEDKAARAGMAKKDTAHAKSKKRRVASVTKIVSKRCKTAEFLKAASAKEEAESTPVDTGAVPSGVELPGQRPLPPAKVKTPSLLPLRARWWCCYWGS